MQTKSTSIRRQTAGTWNQLHWKAVAHMQFAKEKTCVVQRNAKRTRVHAKERKLMQAKERMVMQAEERKLMQAEERMPKSLVAAGGRHRTPRTHLRLGRTKCG